MKKKLALLAFGGWISLAIQAQPTWTWQNPLPQGNDLADVFVLDANTAVAVGFGGTFLKTTDCGASWASIPLMTGSPSKRVTQRLRSVWFNDSQNGYIVGDQGAFLRTANGGDAWTVMQTPFVFDPLNPFKVPDIYSLKSIHFINSQAGWAVGSKQIFENFTLKIVGAVLKTTDGGASWTDCSPATQFTLNAVFFTDAQTGFAAGGTYNTALLLKTANGGQTWTPYADTPAYQGQSIELSALHFPNAQNGWAVGGLDLALKTTNGGTSWAKVDWSALKNYVLPNDVFFPSVETGWIIGSTVLKTTNSGDTWIEQESERIGNAVHFSDNDNGWMAGMGGCLVHTSNGGTEWEAKIRAAARYRLNDIQFDRPSLGWAVGMNGSVVKTTDGGDRWISLSFPSDVDSYAVHFFDADTGWIAGAGFKEGTWTGQVYKTTDGGNAWIRQLLVPGKTLTDICFTDSRTGWMVGESGLLKKTNDGGTRWTDQANPFTDTTQRLEAVTFTDKNHGWIAAGYSGKILATTDGGASWTEQTSGTTEWLKAVYFIDTLTGWAAGGSAVLKTSNGGTVWMNQTLPADVRALESVHFFDALNGFAAGGSTGFSMVIRTSDGGTSWRIEDTWSAQPFNAVFMGGPALAWVAGESGAILKTGQAPADKAPVFVSPNSVTVTEKTAFLYTARAVDPEGQHVSYSFSDYPAWMNAGDSTLFGTAPADDGIALFTVAASDGINTSILTVTVTVLKGTGAAADPEKSVPDHFSLSETYPNPFNPSVSVTFTLPEHAEAVLQVFDVRGKQVKEVFHGMKEAGQYQASWDGTDVSGNTMPSGVYFLRMTAGSVRFVQKMMLIR